MPLTKVETHNIDNYAVSTEKLSNTAVAAFAKTLTPKISAITETDASYTALDDTAMNTSGGYLVITGSDFQSGASVIIDTTNANSTTFVNTTTLQAQIPAKAAGTYNLYVVNPDGGTAIRVNALTYSAFPAFSTGATLTNQSSNAAFGVAIAATSDSNITYSNTSALPAGTTLLSNGWFYGTVSVGAETVYSFTVKATDVELQDTSRTFGLTVNLNPAVGLYAWGANASGSQGKNDTVERSSPSQVGTDTNWSQFEAGSNLNVLAIKSTGTLWSWGSNNAGALGQNDVVNRSSPTQVGALTNWREVRAGYSNSVAIKTDGTLWTWGYGAGGELGTSTILSRSSPVQVGALTNWSKISTGAFGGSNLCAAIKTDGTLWTWGDGLHTQGSNGLSLAGSSNSNRSSPVQIGVLTNWSSIHQGGGHCAAIKTDGTLWTWGLGAYGQLGSNNLLSRSSPVQVGTDTNWSRIALWKNAGRATFAVKTTGTLWAWGQNSAGTNLGLNDLVSRSSPSQVGTDTNWNLLSQGYYQVVSIKTDGTLWTWGINTSGTLGLNDLITRSSPVQIGSATNWSNVSVGTTFTLATTS